MVFLEDGCYIAQKLPGLRSYVIEKHAKSRVVDIPSEIGYMQHRRFSLNDRGM